MQAADWVQQGNDRMGSGDISGASACFDAALRLDPRDAAAHFGKGFASYQLRDYAAAAAALTVSIQLEPDASGVAAAYAIRCMARANLSDRRGAMDDYEEAVSRNPDFIRIFQSQTCVGTAQVVVMATAYPGQFAQIVEMLTRG